MENCKTNYYRSGQDILLALRVMIPETGEEALEQLLAQVIAEVKSCADNIAEKLAEERETTLAAGERWIRRELWMKATITPVKEGTRHIRIQTSYGPLRAPVQITGNCEFLWDSKKSLCVKRI